VAAQLEFEATQASFESSRNAMIQVEEQTGHATLFNHAVGQDMDLSNLAAITKDLNLFSSDLVKVEERLKFCLLRLTGICEYIEDVEGVSVTERTSLRRKGGLELKQHADYLSNAFTCMLHRYEAFQKNAKTQLAVVCNNTTVGRDRLC